MIPMEIKQEEKQNFETQNFSDGQTSSNSSISDDASEQLNLAKAARNQQIASKLSNIRKK